MWFHLPAVLTIISLGFKRTIRLNIYHNFVSFGLFSLALELLDLQLQKCTKNKELFGKCEHFDEFELPVY